MSKRSSSGVEETCRQPLSLLDRAHAGQAVIITKAVNRMRNEW